MRDLQPRYDGSSALVADDDPAVQLTISRFLERRGFHVDTASDGDEALEKAAAGKYDLVITDLVMPGKTGIQFLQAARARGVDAEVIVLTAVGTVTTAVEAMKSGAFEFLEKPVRAERLGEVVAAAMNHRRLASISIGANVSVGTAVVGGEATGSPVAAGRRPVGMAAAGAHEGRPRHPAGSFGRYEVVELIGRGGMGEVYRCRDPLIGRTVAVKVLRLGTEPTDGGSETLARFQREAAAAGALAHPGIVGVYDLGRDETDGVWYIVLELVEGRSLNRMMAGRKPLPVREVVSIGFQVADALAYAHMRRVIHRDVKPSNVIVRADGSTKLLDFGLAAIQGWEVTSGDRVFGSPSYMAPERIRGKPGGPTADQFSLGVVLYEALSGGNPFTAHTPEARLVRVLQEHPPPLATANEEIPEELSSLVARLMSKAVADRFPTTDEAVEAFRAVGKDLGLELKRHAGFETGD